jgi:hypothetical protein
MRWGLKSRGLVLVMRGEHVVPVCKIEGSRVERKESAVYMGELGTAEVCVAQRRSHL